MAYMYDERQRGKNIQQCNERTHESYVYKKRHWSDDVKIFWPAYDTRACYACRVGG